jgi:hypothetical protein
MKGKITDMPCSEVFLESSLFESWSYPSSRGYQLVTTKVGPESGLQVLPTLMKEIRVAFRRQSLFF